MLRWITRALAILVVVTIALVVLDFAELLVPVDSDGRAAMAPTIPACNGRAYTEGFTYKFRDPENGEIVAIHAARGPDDAIVPDRDATDLVLALRVAAGPGDQIVGRDGSVFVNGIKFDDIRTAPFRPVDLGGEQYFVLGDNRSAAIDSRTFGPVLRNAIFAKVFVVFWPLRDFTFRTDPESGTPPGPVRCD
ncbi:MAG: signal peptidase I [Thermoleophilia bacterium]|nr:signal peptidase I [Thermoleophilia bacterium]MDH4340556.1 signal peptidase I [Thermoleophilia bacterium]MDH5281861.1 signal peptidase I [Thermoleophilia bacterium]